MNFINLLSTEWQLFIVFLLTMNDFEALMTWNSIVILLQSLLQCATENRQIKPFWLSVQMCDHSWTSFWLSWQRMGWWWDRGAELILFKCICWELGAKWEYEIPKLGLELGYLAQNRLSCPAAGYYSLGAAFWDRFLKGFKERPAVFWKMCWSHKIHPFLHQWF